MAKRQEAEELLRQGHGPIEVAQIQGVSTKTIVGYLSQSIGEGSLRPYQLLFSIPPERRSRYEKAVHTKKDGTRKLNPYTLRGDERIEAEAYHQCTSERVQRAELYILLADAEIALHG